MCKVFDRAQLQDQTNRLVGNAIPPPLERGETKKKNASHPDGMPTHPHTHTQKAFRAFS